ncbi:MAG: PAS domain-containing protein [Deltaproteobacteria bacterium]|nr:PAS domain-containing protein [Deltaproteobacteria bacterium]
MALPDWSNVLTPALQQVSNGVTVVDISHPDQPLVFVNRAFERITGYTAAESLGRNCRFLQGPNTDPASVESLRKALRLGESIQVVLRNYRKDGTGFLNELKIFPVANPEGSPTQFIGIQNDVTAQFVSLALQQQIRLPSQMLDQVDTVSGPDLHLALDLNDLQVGLETIGVIVATARGKILYRDSAARDLLATGGPENVGDSVFGVFEGSGLIESLRPSLKSNPSWISARVRGSEPATKVLLRCHRTELPELERELMVVLTRVRGGDSRPASASRASARKSADE